MFGLSLDDRPIRKTIELVLLVFTGPYLNTREILYWCLTNYPDIVSRVDFYLKNLPPKFKMKFFFWILNCYFLEASNNDGWRCVLSFLWIPSLGNRVSSIWTVKCDVRTGRVSFDQGCVLNFESGYKFGPNFIRFYAFFTFQDLLLCDNHLLFSYLAGFPSISSRDSIDLFKERSSFSLCPRNL